MNYTIFLDIDGVLNSLDNQCSLESTIRAKFHDIPSNEWVKNGSRQIKYSLNGKGNYKFDERCKRHFNNALELISKIDTSACFNIVLVSAWQYMGIDKFREIWSDEGMYGNVTDFIKNYSVDRGTGILKYLKEHAINDNWVSLDDDAFTYINMIDQSDRFRIVITNSQYGINFDGSKHLLNALTNKKYEHFNKIA